MNKLNPITRIKLVPVLLLFFCIHLLFAKTHTEERLFSFAMSLYNENDYYRAISEFKRFIYFFPKSKLYEKSILFIGKSYYNANRFQQAIEMFSKLTSSKVFDIKSKFLIGDCYVKLGAFEKAIASYTPLKEKYELAYFKTAFCLFLQQKFMEAKTELIYFKSRYPESPLIPESNRLLYYTDNILNFNQKSPIFAAILSGIIPGAGQAYVERYGDGLIALLKVGIMALGVYYFSSVNKNDFLLTLSISLGTIFYLGNIYSAYNSARRYNKLFIDNEINSAKLELWKEFDTP